MSVLGRKKIQRRASEIFESGYEEVCVDAAAYNLRLNDRNLTINGVKYDINNPYDYKENDGYIKLPPRKISVLSTVEKLSLPETLCARVGITFSWSRKGLIPLFGPQVDPGYNDFFYAVIYNASNKEMRLEKEEKLFKMELHTVEEAEVVSQPSYGGLREIDPDMTREDSVGNLISAVGELETNIKDVRKDVKSNETKVNAIEGGYRNIVWFGVFLVAASIFGVVLSFLLSNTDIVSFASLAGWDWFPLAVMVVIALFIIGWISAVVVVIKGMIRGNRGRQKSDD